MKIILAFLFLFFLNGCISNYSDDVSLVSIEAVDYRDQSELLINKSGKTYDPYFNFMMALTAEKKEIK